MSSCGVVRLGNHRIGVRRSKLVHEVLDRLVPPLVGIVHHLSHPRHCGIKIVVLAVTVAVA